MARSSFAEVDCGVAQAVEQLGDKWTLVILRSAFHGIRRFDEFSEHLGIAANVLADRLAKLVEADILTKRKVEEDGRAVEYRLTPKGLDTYPMIIFLNQWAERWMAKPSGPRIEVLERKTGRPILPVQVQAESGQALGAYDTFMQSGPGGSEVLSRSQRIVARRRGNDLR
jgi:DNA-binding HxlR family transcriptional regulator